MIKPTLRKGDMVVIINDGATYSGYATMARKMKLEDWVEDLSFKTSRLH